MKFNPIFILMLFVVIATLLVIGKMVELYITQSLLDWWVGK